MARILRSVGITVIYVTHDHGEAVTIASRIALLHEGRMVQAGTARELLRVPASAFSARFLGLGAVVEGTEAPDGGGVVTPLGAVRLPAQRQGEDALLIRPDAIRLEPCPGALACPARIVSATLRPVGMSVQMMLLGAGGHEYPMDMEIAESGDSWRAGTIRNVWIDPARCLALRP
jgi:ABC-type Fe3+/spermidine/putrescine transport system ATPase subunit